jgi:hypothetical protein
MNSGAGTQVPALFIWPGDNLEHFQKYCGRSARGEARAVFLSFGFVSAQSQGFQTCSFAKASPKRKNPRSEQPQYFFKRSKDF